MLVVIVADAMAVSAVIAVGPTMEVLSPVAPPSPVTSAAVNSAAVNQHLVKSHMKQLRKSASNL